VRVPREITLRADTRGWVRATTFFTTGAQWATLSLVSVLESGYLTTLATTWIEYAKGGATAVAPTTDALKRRL
jgi:hypothetical protein